MRDYRDDPKDFDLDTYCPRCGHLVRALVEAGPIYHIGSVSDQYAYLICRCPRKLCNLMFVTYDRLNNHVDEVYPYARVSATDYHEAIPEKVREDLAEVRRCMSTKAFRSVVVMCRRAMQQMALDKGATGDNLVGQIDDLFKQGIITKSLHDAAHEIRFFGNYGAHPRDDGLDNITRDDAHSIRDLTHAFTVDLYIRPFETAGLTKKRKTQ